MNGSSDILDIKEITGTTNIFTTVKSATAVCYCVVCCWRCLFFDRSINKNTHITQTSSLLSRTNAKRYVQLQQARARVYLAFAKAHRKIEEKQ